MMMKRCLSYFGIALAFLVAPFSAQAVEHISYVVAASVKIAQPYGEDFAKHELAMTQWRAGSGAEENPVKSNLIAISNHFGMSGAAPFSVPDWDSTTSA